MKAEWMEVGRRTARRPTEDAGLIAYLRLGEIN